MKIDIYPSGCFSSWEFDRIKTFEFKRFVANLSVCRSVEIYKFKIKLIFMATNFDSGSAAVPTIA